MSGGTGGDAVFYLLLLILPLSALIARRLPIASVAKMTLAWVVIFALLAIAVGQRDRGRPLFDGVARLAGTAAPAATGGSIRVPMAVDGHFWVDARINGVPTRLLVDSGATTTALSIETAQRAGIAVGRQAFGAALNTANGRVVAMPGTIETLTIGSIVVPQVSVVVAPQFGQTDVIGMNVLSRLKRWQVVDRTLTLTAQ